MEDEMKEVCQDLDETLHEAMACLKQLSLLRTRYKDAVKEGYFAMSQARHGMGGPSRVSSLQYDSAMTPLVHVTMETNSDQSSYDELIQDAMSARQLEVDFKIDRKKSSNRDVGKTKEDGSHAEITVRRRKADEFIEDVPVKEEEEKEEHEDVREEQTVKDPIKWFGILVPQSLRLSQQMFVQAIDHCAAIATAQTKFEIARRKYQRLLQMKEELSVKA